MDGPVMIPEENLAVVHSTGSQGWDSAHNATSAVFSPEDAAAVIPPPQARMDERVLRPSPPLVRFTRVLSVRRRRVHVPPAYFYGIVQLRAEGISVARLPEDVALVCQHTAAPTARFWAPWLPEDLWLLLPEELWPGHRRARDRPRAPRGEWLARAADVTARARKRAQSALRDPFARIKTPAWWSPPMPPW